jgi:hypothetical protein
MPSQLRDKEILNKLKSKLSNELVFLLELEQLKIQDEFKDKSVNYNLLEFNYDRLHFKN